MKNKLFIPLIFFTCLSFVNLLASENLNISAQNISIDKRKEITIFENNVIILDDQNNEIKSNYAEYNKKTNFISLKNNIVIKDRLGNIFKSEIATYDSNKNIFNSLGLTTIKTTEGYLVTTKNIILDNKNNFASSDKATIIKDQDKNTIYLNNFEYKKNEHIFKSVGDIEIIDKLNNVYRLSQIYIDEKKKEITGSDSKAYLNNVDFKINENNKPRIFSNTIHLKEEKSKFLKSNFTMCNYRDKDKCPPWQFIANKMEHNKKKKTVYYDNVILKIYDLPIFYFPKLAHPDPTVKRRSGFLIPSYSDTKNLGTSLNIPYFWAIDEDKDLTIKNRLFASENPLFLGEYRQEFKNSSLLFDFGYTDGYKKTSTIKKPGNKSHFFGNFTKKIFNFEDNIESNLEVNIEHVSNKKYLKLYRIDSNLVDDETGTLENYVDYSRFNDDKNSFLSFRASNYRTLADSYNDKYENILPSIHYDKQLFSDRLGYGNFTSELKVHHFDTNKIKKFFINDIEWSLDDPFAKSFYNGKFLSNLKNINYETQHIDGFKSKPSHELFGAIGYLASVDLYKQENQGITKYLKPKALLKYAPNFMRKETGESSLYKKDIFNIDRLNTDENFEGGANLTLGFDYEKIQGNNKTNFSIGQIISAKENNKKMPDTSGLDKRFSDLVGSFNYKQDERFKFDYNFSLDQNYKETNFNEVNAVFQTKKIDFDFNYLEEGKTSDENEYIKSALKFKKGNNGLLTFSNKRNLITNSSEFYDISYEYLNDCLRAGIAYRREFYNDSELEAENSLMFKVTLSSFGSLTTPAFSK